MRSKFRMKQQRGVMHVSLQAAEVPLQDVPPRVIQVACGFLAHKRAANLSTLLVKIALAIFEDIPESATSKSTPPKAKVSHLSESPKYPLGCKSLQFFFQGLCSLP